MWEPVGCENPCRIAQLLASCNSLICQAWGVLPQSLRQVPTLEPQPKDPDPVVQRQLWAWQEVDRDYVDRYVSSCPDVATQTEPQIGLLGKETQTALLWSSGPQEQTHDRLSPNTHIKGSGKAHLINKGPHESWPAFRDIIYGSLRSRH